MQTTADIVVRGPHCSSSQSHPSNPSLPSAVCIYCSENRDYTKALILPPLETFLMPQAGHGISSPGPSLAGKASMPGEGPWDPQSPFPKDLTEGLTGPGMRLFYLQCFIFPSSSVVTLTPHLLVCCCQTSATGRTGFILWAFS